MLLLLKLILVPILIAAVTVTSRRWGPRVGGLVTALPVVAGPALCFYAVEQGNLFAAEAARATLFGLVAVGGFCIAYAHTARRLTWPFSLAIGWLTFGLVSLLIYRVPFNVLVGLPAAVAALMLARRLLPSHDRAQPRVVVPAWDVPLRMLTAAALVFVLTSVADRLGPALSGVLTPFPVAIAIIAGFTHAQEGAGTVARFFHGFIPGLCSFALFCFVLALTLPSVAIPVAFASALAAQLVLQVFILWRMSTLTPLAGRTPHTASAG